MPGIHSRLQGRDVVGPDREDDDKQSSGDDVQGSSDRRPPDGVAELGRGLVELLLDDLAILLKVCPALVVNGDDGVRPDLGHQVDAVPRSHRVTHWTGDAEPHTTEMN